jgi:polyisoprenoid-binding protein YceI
MFGVRILLLALLSSFPALAAQQRTVYSIDAGKSKMEVHVYKDGLFKAFGHDHLMGAKEMSGEVQFDAQNIESSAVRFKVEAKSLQVIDPGESQKDRQDVQATMTSERVLNVAKFPEIIFTSTHVSSVKKMAAGWELTLSGLLKLHGVEKQVRVPLHLFTEGDQLRAQGEVSLLQTEYGITPVKVGGGAVKVKDKLRVTFTIVAATTNP